MTSLLQKIKKLLPSKKQSPLTEKFIALEEKIIGLEKANLIILTSLLQTSKLSQRILKRDDKTEILIATSKDFNAGTPPTYH